MAVAVVGGAVYGAGLSVAAMATVMLVVPALMSTWLGGGWAARNAVQVLANGGGMCDV